MLKNLILGLDARETVSMISAMSKAADYQIPAFTLILLAIIPGILDELGAAAIIGITAILLRQARREFLNNYGSLTKKLNAAVIKNEITQEQYHQSIEYLQRNMNRNPSA